MDTTNLDERLRKRAQKRLEAELAAATTQYIKQLGTIYGCGVSQAIVPEYKKPIYSICNAIEAVVYAAEVSSREEKEISAFLDNVSNFRKAIAELEQEEHV